MASRITEVTRQHIFDGIRLSETDWAGRLSDSDFLSRVFDLQSLPSEDPRHKDAAGDIWRHREINHDWPDDWVFDDKRFNLMWADDEVLLRFLAETLHPVVRADPSEVSRLVQTYNQALRPDGYELTKTAEISGRPIYSARFVGDTIAPNVKAAREVLASLDLGYVSQQITRMEAAVSNDPELAIGTAKELIETCCKTILSERGVEIPPRADVTKLVKTTAKELKLTPDDIPDQAKAANSIRRLLSNLASVAQGMAEVRNSYGTGHGRPAGRKGLETRHAQLAVGAATTLAVFLVQTHRSRTDA